MGKGRWNGMEKYEEKDGKMKAGTGAKDSGEMRRLHQGLDAAA